jgi:hypothetical protein
MSANSHLWTFTNYQLHPLWSSCSSLVVFYTLQYKKGSTFLIDFIGDLHFNTTFMMFIHNVWSHRHI